MITAKNAYLATPVGDVGTIAYGGSTNGLAEYERFANEVAVLEGMEDQRVIEITFRHHESQTGHRFVDIVKFTRLK